MTYYYITFEPTAPTKHGGNRNKRSKRKLQHIYVETDSAVGMIVDVPDAYSGWEGHMISHFVEYLRSVSHTGVEVQKLNFHSTMHGEKNDQAQRQSGGKRGSSAK